jgi:hypothetical protein
MTVPRTNIPLLITTSENAGGGVIPRPSLPIIPENVGHGPLRRTIYFERLSI